jgi:hypothetical protein
LLPISEEEGSSWSWLGHPLPLLLLLLLLNESSSPPSILLPFPLPLLPLPLPLPPALPPFPLPWPLVAPPPLPLPPAVPPPPPESAPPSTSLPKSLSHPSGSSSPLCSASRRTKAGLNPVWSKPAALKAPFSFFTTIPWAGLGGESGAGAAPMVAAAPWKPGELSKSPRPSWLVSALVLAPAALAAGFRSCHAGTLSAGSWLAAFKWSLLLKKHTHSSSSFELMEPFWSMVLAHFKTLDFTLSASPRAQGAFFSKRPGHSKGRTAAMGWASAGRGGSLEPKPSPNHAPLGQGALAWTLLASW